MSWSWARSLRSAEQDLRMSEGFACSDLQTLQRFVPKKTCTSGLRWAEQGWERATAEAFLFLGTLCPFPTPGYRPGLALWGPGQHHSAGNPPALPTFIRKLCPVTWLGAAPGPCGPTAMLRFSLAVAHTAVSIGLGQTWSRSVEFPS